MCCLGPYRDNSKFHTCFKLFKGTSAEILKLRILVAEHFFHHGEEVVIFMEIAQWTVRHLASLLTSQHV